MRIDLIQRAKAKASGANVHAVNALCQQYEAANEVRLLGDRGWAVPRAEAEVLLRIFIRTGKLPKGARA